MVRRRRRDGLDAVRLLGRCLGKLARAQDPGLQSRALDRVAFTILQMLLNDVEGDLLELRRALVEGRRGRETTGLRHQQELPANDP